MRDGDRAATVPAADVDVSDEKVAVSVDVVAEVSERFACSSASPGTARQFVRGLLGANGIGPLPAIELLVSELVTNVVEHTRSEACVVVWVHEDRVRVEVHDDRPAPPQLRNPGPTELGGRGLQIVRTLSSSWGTERRDAGKVVWFELPHPDSDPHRRHP